MIGYMTGIMMLGQNLGGSTEKSTVQKDCCYEHGQLYNKHSQGTMTPTVCPLWSICRVKQCGSRKGDLTTKLNYLTLF